MPDLGGRKVAILATHGVEQVELTEPRRALEEAGAAVTVIAPDGGTIRAWNRGNWGQEIEVDVTLSDARPQDYDALMLPGGVMNPDKLRMERKAVDLVRAFSEAGMPIAAICHAPWMLVEADVVQGRRVTSYPSLRRDLENAGAEWIDAAVVTDQGLVTSRRPDDIPAFNRKMIEEIGEGVHAARA